MARMWSEVGVEEVDFKPFIDDTNTFEKWKEWAKQDILVKVKADSTNAKDNGEIEIERCTASTDVPIGIIRSISGHPSNFPRKLSASVAVAAWDCNLSGADTGELADDDFGRQIQPDAEGKATIITSGDGWGRVVGGTKPNLRFAFDFRENFR